MTAKHGHLLRSVGIWGLAAMAFNGMVGAGIFSLPGTVSAHGGSWAPLIVLGVGLAMLLAAYAFIGFEGALTPAGEARSPRRDIPIAVLGVFIAVVLLYAALTWGFVALAYDPLHAASAPLAQMAHILAGKVGLSVILATAALSIMGNIIGTILFVSRRL